MEKEKKKSKFIQWLKKQLDKLWGWIKPYLTTWQGIVGMLVSWCIIDGWPYVFIAIGTLKNIPWMLSVGLFAEAILWQPWMIEKPLVVIPLGILFKKILDKIFKNKKGKKYEPKQSIIDE